MTGNAQVDHRKQVVNLKFTGREYCAGWSVPFRFIPWRKSRSSDDEAQL